MNLIPNYISVGRIVLSLFLLLVKPLSGGFYAIYIICGLSDIIDGYIARRTAATSRLGEKLDSIADIIMLAVLIIILYPIVDITRVMVIWILSIGLIRIVSMAIGFKKYKTFAMLHTYGNKITGMALFLFPLFIGYFHNTVVIYVICVIASLSAIEELIIQLTSRQLEINKPSIFIKTRD